MDDLTTRTYGTNALDNRPLFGETSARVGGRSVSRRHDAFLRLSEMLHSSSVLVTPQLLLVS